MNGKYIFSTENLPYSKYGNADPTRFLVSVPNLSNNMGLSFFGTSDRYSGLAVDWQSIENKVASNSAKLAANTTSAVSSSVSESVSTGTRVAESIGAGGVGMAALVAQQIGGAIAQGQAAKTENQIQADRFQNLNQHGLNTQLNADLITSHQEATKNSQLTGGMIGSLFGPVGALIGSAAASVISANPNLFDTARGFGGGVNPTDTGISATMNTSGATGESTMVDNVTS